MLKIKRLFKKETKDKTITEKKLSGTLINRIQKIFRKELKDYAVKVKGLNINYGSKNVLNNINFVINNKDIYGIIGLSGSGKTTLLKALMGFIPYQGIIDKASKKIGYCPQEDAFFKELSIRENVIIYGNMTSTSPGTALERAGKLMKEMEITESINKTAGMMSGGQRKRLNIILSILHEPDTIILDEPFAGLDYMNRLLLWKFIKELRRKGKTVILTTHLLDEAEEYCSNLLIISEGKKFATGSISDISRKLRLRQYMMLKFKYLNQENASKIKNYCSKRGYWIISINENSASFGLPGTEDRNKMLEMIDRLSIEYTVNEYRAAELNELLMASVKT